MTVDIESQRALQVPSLLQLDDNLLDLFSGCALTKCIPAVPRALSSMRCRLLDDC